MYNNDCPNSDPCGNTFPLLRDTTKSTTSGEEARLRAMFSLILKLPSKSKFLNSWHRSAQFDMCQYSTQCTPQNKWRCTVTRKCQDSTGVQAHVNIGMGVLAYILVYYRKSTPSNFFINIVRKLTQKYLMTWFERLDAKEKTSFDSSIHPF